MYAHSGSKFSLVVALKTWMSSETSQNVTSQLELNVVTVTACRNPLLLPFAYGEERGDKLYSRTR